MYQLDVILIGCHDDVLPHIRRELMNNHANIEAEFRDVAFTLEKLRATKTEKRLLILHLKAFEGLDELRTLCHALPSWPVMVMMDTGGEDRTGLNSAFLTAMRTGASQIVGLPIHPEDIKTALDRISMQFVYSAEDKSKVIAVAGVTGGCGATSLAINLGQEFVHIWHKRCILVELSLKMGVIASHLNLEPPHSIHDLLTDARRVDETLLRKVLFKISDQYELLAGPDRLISSQGISSTNVIALLERLKPLCDVILIDLPCTYDDFYFEILAAATQIVLVGEQKVPAIRALKLVHEMVHRPESGEAEHLVINRFHKTTGSLSTELLLRILDVHKLHTIVQDAPAFSEAVNRGCTLRLAAPRSQALADIGALAKTLLEGDAAIKAPVERSTLMGRLVHAFV